MLPGDPNVDWNFKTECCGASNHVIRPKAARNATERVFHNAQINGAECIATACPLCWMNLDMREEKINSEHKTNYHMPIYFFTELIALALGASPNKQESPVILFQPKISQCKNLVL